MHLFRAILTGRFFPTLLVIISDPVKGILLGVQCTYIIDFLDPIIGILLGVQTSISVESDSQALAHILSVYVKANENWFFLQTKPGNLII